MDDIISMAHGSGGKKTSDIINEILLPRIGNGELNNLGDGALLELGSKSIAFSTDSFVIDPYFFPGGDIGKLSVCGTVNDMIMCGSIPKYLSLSFILEEGFSISKLETIVESIKATIEKAEVKIVTGDTKVVNKNHGHGIYINTAGIGEKIQGLNLSISNIKKGDKVILTGTCGNHGISILCARENLLISNIVSDCMPLTGLIDLARKYKNHIRIMRDPTRGGVATTLNEFTENMEYSIELIEESIPIDEDVKAAASLLGLDPLYSANEGKALIIVSKEASEELLKDLRAIEEFNNAAIIGEVVDYLSSKVVLKNFLGARRILDKLTYEPLPRIC